MKIALEWKAKRRQAVREWCCWIWCLIKRASGNIKMWRSWMAQGRDAWQRWSLAPAWRRRTREEEEEGGGRREEEGGQVLTKDPMKDHWIGSCLSLYIYLPSTITWHIRLSTHRHSSASVFETNRSDYESIRRRRWWINRYSLHCHLPTRLRMMYRKWQYTVGQYGI